MWIKPPGWRPEDVAARFPKAAFDISHARYNPSISPAWKTYCLVQFAVLLLIGVNFLGVAPKLEFMQAAAYAIYLVYSLWTIGFLMEGRRLGVWLECGRTLGTMLAVALSGRWFGVAHLDQQIVLAVCLVAGISTVMLFYVTRHNVRHSQMA